MAFCLFRELLIGTANRDKRKCHMHCYHSKIDLIVDFFNVILAISLRKKRLYRNNSLLIFKLTVSSRSIYIS